MSNHKSRAQARWPRALLGLAVLLALVIGYESLLPGSGLPPTRHSDKIVHFVAYFTLAFMFCASVSTRWRKAALLGVIAYGGLIEILQSAMALGRTGSWGDMAANIGGALIGAILAGYITQLFLGRRRRAASHLVE